MTKPTHKKVRVPCRVCQTQTHHDILYSNDSSDLEYDDNVKVWLSDQVLKCCGCDAISFRHTSQSSDDIDFLTGEPVLCETIYPNRFQGRVAVVGCDEFPPNTRRIYMETLKALNQQAFILTAIGLRAIIESICVDQKIPGKNLEARIDGLANSGQLSKKQADWLHAHRFMGNAAAHEMLAPKPSELVSALDIAETLLKTIYILPSVADQLKPKAKTAGGS